MSRQQRQIVLDRRALGDLLSSGNNIVRLLRIITLGVSDRVFRAGCFSITPGAAAQR